MYIHLCDSGSIFCSSFYFLVIKCKSSIVKLFFLYTNDCFVTPIIITYFHFQYIR